MTLRAAELSVRVTILALGAGCLLGLLHVLAVIGLHVPFDPNEGWNAYFAQMAMTRGTPYPPAESFVTNNYPPLSFYAIGEFGRLLGDNIVAGRIVSLLALVGTAVGIGEAARRMGCTLLSAAFAGLMFIAAILETSDYAGMNDPQLLGHVVATWGLVIALSEPRTSRTMLFAALLFTLAFFVKHNLALLPIALGGWLSIMDRRHAATFIGSMTVFLLIGFGIFREVFGTSLVEQIASARVYAFANVVAGALSWLVWAAIPLCGAVVLICMGRRDQFVVLAILYAAVSTTGGLMFLSGAGVDTNVLFDADIALALCAGLLLDRMGTQAWSVVAAGTYLIALLFALRDSDGDWGSPADWLHPMAQERESAAVEIELLRTSRDPVLCEMLALCYWAGKPAQVDVFNTAQRIRAGTLSADRLVRQIEGRRFSIIQLETLHPFPLPPVVEHAILRNYQTIRSDDERVFLAPRQ